jgi:hypothetical protein
LVNLLPDSARLNAERQLRGQTPVSFKVQRIEDATSEHINFDTYSVVITRLPPGVSPDQLFQKVRRDINEFLDNDVGAMVGYRRGDAQDWKSSASAPLGSILVWHISSMEQAGVVTSLSEPRRWIFTPVTIGRAFPGEHPVSGNREFGLRPGPGNGWTIYTRGVDRVLASLLPGEDIVFGGQDALWRSFQNGVASYVNAAGGRRESSLA